MNDTEMHPVCEKLVAYLETGEAAAVDGAPTPEGFVMELAASTGWRCTAPAIGTRRGKQRMRRR
jgi:hypothetical protein